MDNKSFDSNDINDIFIEACEYNNIEIVKVFLKHPYVDPSANNSCSLTSASYYCNYEIVDLLLEDGRVDPTADCDYFARDSKIWTMDDINRVCNEEHGKYALQFHMYHTRANSFLHFTE